MDKRAILIELLMNYRVAESTAGRSDAKGSGEQYPRMPKSWTPSYRELERCLHVMSGDCPKLARQILGRYVDPVTSRKKLVGKVEHKPGGREVLRWKDMPDRSEVLTFTKLPEHGLTNQYTCLVVTWPRWVRASLVEAGLRQLEALYSFTPQLAKDDLKAALRKAA